MIEVENRVTEEWSVQEGQGTVNTKVVGYSLKELLYAYLKLNTIHKCMWGHTHTHTLKKAKPLGLFSCQEPQTNKKNSIRHKKPFKSLVRVFQMTPKKQYKLQMQPLDASQGLKWALLAEDTTHFGHRTQLIEDLTRKFHASCQRAEGNS